ncbi:ribonuclease H-like domain-containing protein [Schizophyllum amplum]|uniref:Ribonuclease n=1 Tax=Schizophyllum amplum TaxID=97359 RepID=A0A550CIP1_9AGAR|nr:ribonuclease H-like domain-containing protein [Auriculariopsis ampla]
MTSTPQATGVSSSTPSGSTSSITVSATASCASASASAPSLTPSTSIEPSISTNEVPASPSDFSISSVLDSASLTHLHFPLTSSYTYHAPIPTASGPYILGVDEAGRGPVLGPLVYGVAYVAESEKARMEGMGFADSKTLDAARREALLATLSSAPDVLGWAVRVISPQCLSAGMLRRPPTNLNEQSRDATVLLIRGVLARGVQLSAVFVDALGPTAAYEVRLLSSQFPGIKFTVANKADSKFKIVGAASVAAKVTRDALLEGWVYEEDATPAAPTSRFPPERGSGYPSDPKTKAWLVAALEPTFGFPRAVRFSWATSKVLLDKHAHAVKWTDEGDAALTAAFNSVAGRDKDRCAVTRELGVRSVGAL